MTVTSYKEGAGSESQIVQTQVCPAPPSSLMVTEGPEGIPEAHEALF